MLWRKSEAVRPNHFMKEARRAIARQHIRKFAKDSIGC
jgi:hypothetical protein